MDTFLSLILTVIFLHCTIGSKITDIEIAKQWLSDYNEMASYIQFDYALAEWTYYTNLTDENLKNKTKQNVRQSVFFKEAAENTTLFDWENFNDFDVKRQFSKIATIGSAKLPKEKFGRLDTVQSEMMRIYGTGEVCNKPGDSDPDKCYQLDPDVKRMLASERDWDLLEWLWKGWRDATGKKMPDMYTEFVNLQNEGAKLNGFSDNGEYWKSRYEDDDFETKVGELWEEVKPLYEQLHAYVRNILLKVYKDNADKFPSTGQIPAHLLGNMWSQEWNEILDIVIPYPNSTKVDVTDSLKEQGYTALKMCEVSEEFYTSLGLIEFPDLFWEKSMITRPDDREVVCHGSAYDFFNQKDFRIRQCSDITMEWLITTHHEMGHVQYGLQYKDLPVIYRDGANPGFHEAVGDVMSMSVTTPEHLEKIGLLSEVTHDYGTEINYQLSQALKKVAFLPFGYMIDQWRWSVFRGETKQEEYNKKWWELRCKLQGVAPPVPRSSTDFDPGAKYHMPKNTPYIRYFVSHILQFQFHKSVCEAAGQTGPLHRCDIYQSTEAGTKLSNMLKLGSSRPWPEALEAISGTREMSADALLEYFQPLMEWLTEENRKNGVKIGWEDECPEGTFTDSSSKYFVSSTLLVVLGLLHCLLH